MSDQNDYQQWNINCSFYSNNGGLASLMVNCPDIAFPELTDELAIALVENFKAAFPAELQPELQISISRTHTVLTPVAADMNATPPAFPS